ncbi:hypothetical protein LCGC14_1198860, partial [marine sediment metagenome]
MASQEQLNAVLAALLAAGVIATPPPQFLVAAIDANLDPAAIVAAVQEGGVPALIAATEAAEGAAATEAAQVLTDSQDRPVGPRTIAPTDAQDRPIAGAPPPQQLAPAGGAASNEDIAGLFSQQHPGFDISSFLPGGGVLTFVASTPPPGRKLE